MAKGEWIAFLDADDIWYPRKLELVVSVIKNSSEAAVICHNEYRHVESISKRTLLCHGPYEEDFYRVLLVQGNRVSTSAVTVRASFLTNHDLRFNTSPDFAVVEDYDLWLNIALHGGRFSFIDEPLGEYTIGNDNLTLDFERFHRNRTCLLRTHVFNIQKFEPNHYKLWRMMEVRLAIQSSKQLFYSQKYLSAVIGVFGAVSKSPISLVLYLYWWAKRKVRHARLSRNLAPIGRYEN